jgi:uroporphyrinogen-III synthase
VPPAESPAAVAPRRRRSDAAAWLAAFLLLLGAVLGSPYWAPAVVSLLPWGTSLDEALAARVAALERQATAPPRADPRVASFEQRLAALEQRSSAMDRRLSDAEAKLRTPAAAGAPADPAALGDLAARVDALQKRPVVDPAALRQLSEIQQRLAELGARLDILEKRPSVDPSALAPLEEDQHKLALDAAALADRLTRLEQRVAGAAVSDAGERRSQALLIAVGQLRDAVDRGEPFVAALDTVETLARERPEALAAVASLRGAAAAGVSTRSALVLRFDTVADDILRAATSTAGDDLGDQILARLRSLVVIRRVTPAGAPLGDDPAAQAVTGAETALKTGNLAAAVAALSGLAGPAGEAAKPWLAAARARLAAEAAVAKLGQAATASLLAPPAPNAPGVSTPSGAAKPSP